MELNKAVEKGRTVSGLFWKTRLAERKIAWHTYHDRTTYAVMDD